MADYVRAGGVQAPDVQMKADLLRILPREMRELLLWHVTDMNIGFARFRDTVVAQTAMVLMNRGGGKYINVLDEPQQNDDHQSGEGDDCYTSEENAAWEQELLAEFRRGKGGGKGGGRRAKRRWQRPSCYHPQRRQTGAATLPKLFWRPRRNKMSAPRGRPQGP